MLDTDMTNLSASETTTHALMNLWNVQCEGPYAVHHGCNPVPDFPQVDVNGFVHPSTNVFEKAFPCLYPYGCGGIEAERVVSVDFRDHVRWSL